MTSQLACSPFSLIWQIEKCDFLDPYFNDSDLLTLNSLNPAVNKAAICPGIPAGVSSDFALGGFFWGVRRVTLPDRLWKGPALSQGSLPESGRNGALGSPPHPAHFREDRPLWQATRRPCSPDEAHGHRLPVLSPRRAVQLTLHDPRQVPLPPSQGSRAGAGGSLPVPEGPPVDSTLSFGVFAAFLDFLWTSTVIQGGKICPRLQHAPLP